MMEFFTFLDPKSPDPLASLPKCMGLVVSWGFANFLLAWVSAAQMNPAIPKPGFLSFITGAWIIKHIRPVTSLQDFPQDSIGTPGWDSNLFVKRLEDRWSPHKSTSLFRAVLLVLLPTYIKTHVMRLYKLFLSLVEVYIMQCIGAYVAGSHDVSAGMWIMALALTVIAFDNLHSTLEAFVGLCDRSGGINVTAMAVQLKVFRKVQRLGPKARACASVAEVQQFIADLATNGTSPAKFLMGPLMFCGVSAISALWCSVQLSAFFGVSGVSTGLITAAMLSRAWRYSKSENSKFKGQERNLSKERLGLVHELSTLLLPLKLYGWAPRYTAPLELLAQKSSTVQRALAMWNALSTFLQSAMVDMVILVALGISTFVNNQRIEFGEFMAAQVYVAMLKKAIENLTSTYADGVVFHQVITRVEDFLRQDDWQRPLSGPVAVLDATFAAATPDCKQEAWKAILTSVNLEVKPGELVVISGPLASGKSSLLLSLAGELQRQQGDASLPEGPVAYQPQDSPYHLRNGSIRDNIIFCAEDVNEDHLQLAISASQLCVDFDNPESTLHTQREYTSVGHEGGALSGGQQQRVALARAVFASLSGSKLAFLDDPLAALDNETVQAAWKQSVVKVMKSATRLVVVGSQLLSRLGPEADRIILLDSGKVVYNDSPKKLLQDTALLKKLGDAYLLDISKSAAHEERIAPPERRNKRFQAVAWSLIGMAPKLRSQFDIVALDDQPSQQGLATGDLEVQQTANALDNVAPDANAFEHSVDDLVDFLKSSDGMKEFMQEDLPPLERAMSDASGIAGHGTLKLTAPEWTKLRQLLHRVYSLHQPTLANHETKLSPVSHWTTVKHFVSHTIFWTLLSFVAIALADACVPGYTHTLAAMDHDKGKSESVMLFCIFAVFLLGESACDSLSQWAKDQAFVQLSLKLKAGIERTMVRLSMQYFWTQGHQTDHDAAAKLLKIATMDPSKLQALALLPIKLIQTCLSVGAVVWARPSLLPLVLLTAWIQKQLLFAKRFRKKGIEPLFMHNTAVLEASTYAYNSLTTMRMLGREARFFREAQCKAMQTWVFAIHQWWGAQQLVVTLDIIPKVVFMSCAMACIMQIKTLGGEAATAFILYRLISKLSSRVQEFNQHLSDAQDALLQYSFVNEFVATSHQEDPDDGRQPPQGWPSVKPAIEFQDVSFRYAPKLVLALRLSGSLKIEGGWKVGIVAPPGSGKSTLVSLLFRLSPLHGVEGPGGPSGGRILIDGIDTAKLKLSALRCAVGIVPQTPPVFQDTLKVNIGSSLSDAEALAVLHRVHLDSFATVEQLNKHISKLGEMSVGQKQLLSVARALARGSRVLVLDECTKALDQESSDNLAQVIEDECNGVTVLSIAHRLRFVRHYDRILALRPGGTVENFDSPDALLQKPDSYFYQQWRHEQ